MKKAVIISISIFLFAVSGTGQTIRNCTVCGKQLLTETQLAGNNLEKLSLLRNEIFARKGYVFKDRKYQNYFENQDWYQPVSDNSKVKLSDIETQNVNLLKTLESKIQKKRDAAIRDLKKLKEALNHEDEQVIDAFLHKLKSQEADNYKGLVIGLSKTLNHIDLDDIHWNNGRGFYSVSYDNGYRIFGYRIEFIDNQIRIQKSDNGHSEIFGEFDDGYSDYMSEIEYQEFWIFEMQEDGIVFDRFDGEAVHYEAPPSARVPQEMKNFVKWYNSFKTNGNIQQIIIKTAITHLYFESIHPFEDGNGRIGRALIEKCLSESLDRQIIMSISQIIGKNKNRYYDEIKRVQCTLEIDGWLLYFSQLLIDAQQNALDIFDFSIKKTLFFDKFKSAMNERQTKAINKMLDAGKDGFEGGMTAKKYISIAKTTKATASRDLQQLVELGILEQFGKGRSVHYQLTISQ